LIEESLSILENPELRDQDVRSEKAFALLCTAGVLACSDPEQARAFGEQSLTLRRALGDRRSSNGWVRTLSLGKHQVER
jgi:hypothetical protein